MTSTDSSCLLAFLLTANHEAAERCFVAALDRAFKASAVFKEWATSWIGRILQRRRTRLNWIAAGGGFNKRRNSEALEKQCFCFAGARKGASLASRGLGPSGVHLSLDELRMNDGRRVACWDYFVLPQGANAAIRSWLRLPQPLQVQARTGYSAPAD